MATLAEDPPRLEHFAVRGHPWLAMLVGVIIGIAAGLVVSAVATAEIQSPRLTGARDKGAGPVSTSAATTVNEGILRGTGSVAPDTTPPSSGPSSPSSGPETGIWEASPTALRSQGAEAMAYFAEKVDEARLWARWSVVARNEESGNWSAHGCTRVGCFSGALGIMDGLYESIAGHSALLDPPLAQMRVAEVVLARYGRRAWTTPVP